MKPDIFYYRDILFPKPQEVINTQSIIDYRTEAFKNFSSNDYQRAGRTDEQIMENTGGFIIEIAVCQALGIPFDYDFDFTKNWVIDVSDSHGTKFQCKRVKRDDHFLLTREKYEQTVKLDENKQFINDFVVTGFYTENNNVFTVDISNIITIQSYCADARWSTQAKTKGMMNYNIRAHPSPKCLMNPRIYA